MDCHPPYTHSKTHTHTHLKLQKKPTHTFSYLRWLMVSALRKQYRGRGNASFCWQVFERQWYLEPRADVASVYWVSCMSCMSAPSPIPPEQIRSMTKVCDWTDPTADELIIGDKLPSRWELCCNLDGLKCAHYYDEWNDNLEQREYLELRLKHT